MQRNFDISFAVILSAYGDGRLLGRREICTLGPKQRLFLPLDELLDNLGWRDNVSLCVLHRVPSALVKSGCVIQGDEAARSMAGTDFSLYRTVVQYGSDRGGMGSVVYETPPNLNRTGRKAHFLSFTNKTYVSDDVENYLVYINYSVDEENSQVADVRVAFHEPSGIKVRSTSISVAPYSTGCLRINDFFETSRESRIFGISSSTVTSSLIPLSIAVSRENGGVTVEHAHPPQEYLMADRQVVGSLKSRAARHLFGQ